MELDDDLQERARVLGDPTRFAILRLIASAPSPIGVSELNDAVGFNANNIRQHLAVLVDASFVNEFDEQRTTRGRPRKLYTLRPEALQGLDVGITPYQRLAELLLRLHQHDGDPYSVGYEASEAYRAVVGAETDELADALAVRLRTEGFSPEVQDDGVVRLDVCPFADAAAAGQAVVCELHRGLIDGQLRSADSGVRAELIAKDPHLAGCLVRLQRDTD